MRWDIKELDNWIGPGRQCQIVVSPEATGTKEITVLHVEMDPGGATAVHTHDGIELMFYMEGHGEMTMGDKVITVGPGVAVLAEKGVVHQLRNGNEPMKLLCVYSPPIPDSFITSIYKKGPRGQRG